MSIRLSVTEFFYILFSNTQELPILAGVSAERTAARTEFKDMQNSVFIVLVVILVFFFYI